MSASRPSPRPVRRLRHRLLSMLTALACALLGVGLSGAFTPAAAADPYKVLVFSKTAGFRHDSISSGITAIRELGAANNFTVDATEDATAFTTANLGQYKAVVFLLTTGDVLNATQQSAFEGYIRGGGGYAGVHSAADTEYDWPWYGSLVGAYFNSHPSIQQATIRVADRSHPSTAHLGETWVRTDEWYNYGTNPRSAVNVLATIDESTYSGGNMGADHPIAWYHDYDGGRSWYTGGGHTDSSYSEPDFRKHLLGGIQYAAGTVGAPPAAGGTFSQVTLAKGVAEVGEPMTLAVLPDRSVLHTSRDGKLRLTDAAGNTKLSATIPVYTGDEEGLQGVGIDPGFATNRFVYLYYAPVFADNANGVNRLSRFVLSTSGTLDLASEVKILDVAATRDVCCHVGGDIDFDAAGNLYLTTGDDTNPFESDGSTPIDERPGRQAYDAQRSAGNTNDLRGKLLRIKVNANGTYSIPSGNLFPVGTAKTRPEIYAMGLRNPFRMSVDKPTGIVYLGDYGPDGGASERGPDGQVEFDRITGPGNYGWPYCTGNNDAYKYYSFPSGPVGATFDCAGGPTNNSPNNTGLTKLPPAQPAWITYGGASSPPEFGGGSESPMGGPVYRYDANNTSDVKFPRSYDGKYFAGEFGRRWIKTIVVNADGSPGAIESFPWSGTQVMDMAFGPDGALYVLDYGTSWFGGDANSALYRIDYVTGNRAPTAVASANRTSGGVPLAVQFTGSASSDPDGDTLAYAWDFDGNGTTDSTQVNPSHTYNAAGTFTARLTVTDPGGKSGTTNVSITAGNTAPVVTINSPANGSVFSFGDTIAYSVTVTDPDEGTIDCSRVSVTYILGHDQHGHPESTTTGCSGSIPTAPDGGHGPEANIFGALSASYTDAGGLKGTAEAKLQPATRQAEHYSASSGIQQYTKSAAHGGTTVGNIENGDWISFTPYNLTGVTGFSARVSSGGSGGTLEFRSGSATGTLVGSATVANTGGWETFVDVTGTITNPGGTADLYLVFKGGSGFLFDVDDFTFVKSSTSNTPLDLTPGSTATASSVESGSYPASNAVDGNLGSRWSSQFSDPQSITVDLGEAHTVTGVKLTWESAYGSAYSVQTSADGSTWRAASYSTTSGDGGVDDVTFATAAADTRYVRVTGTTRGTPWGYSLYEFQVYGS